jgi:hypothetical protein
VVGRPCSRWLLRLAPLAPSLVQLLLEEVVNLAVSHAALAPSLPDRCENLREGLCALPIRAIDVGGDHFMDVGGGGLAARGRAR